MFPSGTPELVEQTLPQGTWEHELAAATLELIGGSTASPTNNQLDKEVPQDSDNPTLMGDLPIGDTFEI